jgi:tetratricopeptide (TPR) repeat protein
MPDNDWFCNKEWNVEIETRFFEKLRRARDKAQYLKIQAGCLAESHPNATLALLDKYFALGDQFHLSQGFLSAATAYLSLGQTDEAIRSLRKALEQERKYPNVKTAAWSKFVLVVAVEKLESHFEEALQVLTEHGSRFTFPVEVFQWHAAHALIREAQGNRQVAKEHAIKALDAAQTTHSGFRYHPQVGLVGDAYEGIKNRLLKLSGRYC